MPADTIDQIIEQLNSTPNSLIALPRNPSGDVLGAALALRSFLHKLNKEVVVVAASTPETKYNFLPGINEITTALEIAKNFVIEVSTKRTQIDELSYKKEADKLAIYLKPKTGEFKDSDISFKTADFPFGLIITLGVNSLEELGDFYAKNAEMFFQTPIINIDYHSTNQAFGQFNLIQINSTSCSEVVMDLINRYESSLIDEEIATALLTGIISETNSFQHTRTTPQTFIKASQLVSSGAKQREIVNSLYQSKSLSFLKLWGRSLANINQDEDLDFVYTAVSKSDMENSNASQKEAEQIIIEMGLQLKSARYLLVFIEVAEGETEVYATLPPSMNPMTFFAQYNPVSIAPQTVKFKFSLPLLAAETQIAHEVKQRIA